MRGCLEAVATDQGNLKAICRWFYDILDTDEEGANAYRYKSARGLCLYTLAFVKILLSIQCLPLSKIKSVR